MIDYHLHGDFCGHAEGEPEDYVLEAISKGFKEIGISAHLPKVVDPDPYHAMLEEDLPRYVGLVGRLREKYADEITVRLGIEADYFPGHEDDTARLLKAYPFDYVLGAVHFIGDWHFTSLAGRDRYAAEDPAVVFPEYFRLLADAVSTGLFDILAHPDALRKESFRPPRQMLEEYAAIAGMLAAGGMAVEVSSAGLRRGAGSLYPEKDFLRACLAENVPVTPGSDAHTPLDVGRDFEELFRFLEEAGARDIATWKERRMTRRPVGDFRAVPPAAGRG